MDTVVMEFAQHLELL